MNHDDHPYQTPKDVDPAPKRAGAKILWVVGFVLFFLLAALGSTLFFSIEAKPPEVTPEVETAIEEYIEEVGFRSGKSYE